MCTGMCVEKCTDVYIRMCTVLEQVYSASRPSMCAGMCEDVRVDVNVDICCRLPALVCLKFVLRAGMCTDMRADTRMDVCVRMCVGMCIGHVESRTQLISYGILVMAY